MSRQSEPKDIRARPNTVPWPPIVLLGAVIVGGLLGSFFPTLLGRAMTGYFPLSWIQVWVGWLMVGLAVVMDFWILTIFKNHKTNIRPDRPAENLVTVGPFAYSRNPIYVGNVAIILGLAMVNGSMWYLLLVPIVSCLIQELAIKREEAHMAMRFGDVWKAYSGTVRRWL
jgi:protein-S-isoprenylcysteine O-methyltransferase Ste14